MNKFKHLNGTKGASDVAPAFGVQPLAAAFFVV